MSITWRGRKIPNYVKMLDQQDTKETSDILAKAYDRVEKMEIPYHDFGSMRVSLRDVFDVHLNVCIENILKEHEAGKAFNDGRRLTTQEEYERCHKLLLDGSLVEFQEFICTLKRVTHRKHPAGERKTINIIDFMGAES